MIAPVLTELAPRSAHGAATFAEHVRAGLTAPRKFLSSQYFYDAVGMRIFQEIMELPEYYLTAAEFRILRDSCHAIAAAAGDGPLNIVDLGSGDARKTRILLDAFASRGAEMQYFPVDISRDTLAALTAALSNEYPALPVHGIAAEYFDALAWVKHHRPGPTLVLFLGSNIGNFPPEKARVFLRSLHDALRPGDTTVIGFDLKKDPEVILRAYSDSAGVTARFNLNLLDRINRELGGEFDSSTFIHHAYYDPLAGAARSSLLSTKRQSVRIAAIDLVATFDAWEAIHTEDSWKFSRRDVQELAAETGFAVSDEFIDAERRFVDSLWRVSAS